MGSQAKLNILITTDTKDSEAKVSGLQKALGGLSKLGGVAAGGIAVGMAAIGTALGFSVGEAMDAEAVMAQLDAVLQSTGGAAGVTADMATGLADSLSQVTRFGDEAILSGESMLLTFTNIGKDVFPQVTETMLDMSQAMGQDIQSSAVQLGKALNNPVEGITALTRVGVTFTDEQKTMIEQMVESGDIMGAQTVILQELQKEFGGSAKAAGQTFAGKLDILKTKFGNIAESIGNALLPKLSELATMLLDKLNDPAVQATIDDIAAAITNFAGEVVKFVPVLITHLSNFVNWLLNHREVIVGVLVALGVAFAAFVYTTVIPAVVALIASLAPIIAVFAVIAGVAALVYKAWTENWGGIRDLLTSVWENNLKPIFESVKVWFQTYIPIAIQYMSNYWNTVLKPALMAVWGFIKQHVIPIFQDVFTWLQTNIPVAVETVRTFWETKLKPAFETVVNFVKETLIPGFETLRTFLVDKFQKAVEGIKTIWDKVNTTFNNVKNTAKLLWDRLVGFKDFIAGALSSAFSDFRTVVLDPLEKAWNNIKNAVSGVKSAIQGLIDKLKNLKLPAAFTPGSPTPFEIGLRGINRELDLMAKRNVPQLSVGLQTMSSRANQTTAGITNQYYLTAQYRYQDEGSLADDIRLLQMLGRYA